MPARIYALAKELKVDSKDLVDLVKKVGITGKGSALASLTDEEAQKVRDHISGAGKPEPAARRISFAEARRPVPLQWVAVLRNDSEKAFVFKASSKN